MSQPRFSLALVAQDQPAAIFDHRTDDLISLSHLIEIANHREIELGHTRAALDLAIKKRVNMGAEHMLILEQERAHSRRHRAELASILKELKLALNAQDHDLARELFAQVDALAG